MELTHEIAGALIAVAGALTVLLAGPVPRQVHRWNLQTLDLVEPAMLVWVVRALGIALFMLGIVTLGNFQ